MAEITTRRNKAASLLSSSNHPASVFSCIMSNARHDTTLSKLMIMVRSLNSFKYKVEEALSLWSFIRVWAKRLTSASNVFDIAMNPKFNIGFNFQVWMLLHQTLQYFGACQHFSLSQAWWDLFDQFWTYSLLVLHPKWWKMKSVKP